jgi:iron complex outermembrane receptor protein
MDFKSLHASHAEGEFMGRDGIVGVVAVAGRVASGALGLLLAVSSSRPACSQETSSAPKPKGAAAQTVPAGTQEAQPVLQEVVITATGTNISGITPVGSEDLNLSRDDILNTGIQDLHDVLRTLPQVVDVAPAGVADIRQGGTSGYNANNTQGTAINLRGLGPQATLVLVDGHRVTPTGTVAVFTDADQVPIAALGGVEIIDDGNSAIYGSDAVGGVINYVIRKDLEGVEVTGRSTLVDGYDEYGGAVTGGHTWSSLGSLGKGNFILGLDYDWRGAMRESSSPFLSDVSQFGGFDNRIRGNNQASGTSGAVNGGVGPGQPGNTSTPAGASNVNWCDNYNPLSSSCSSGTYLYRGLPTGTGVPTFAQTLATPSLGDRASETDYLGRQWRYQLTAFYNQDLTSWLSTFFEGFWTRRDVYSANSQYNSPNASAPITINPGSPYYITPPGPAGGPMYLNYAPTAHGVPLWYVDNPDTNWTVITGLKAALGGGWNGNLSISVGRDKTCGICNFGTNVDNGALQHEINIGAINPFSSTPLTAAQLATFMGSNLQWSQMGIEDYVLRFDGPLFDLPGGTVKAAAGGEFQHNTEYLQNGASRTVLPAEGIDEESLPPPQGLEGVGCAPPLPCPPRNGVNQFAWDNLASSGRHISSGFVELFVPVIGAANEVPLVKSLSLDAAGRFDDYSDVGSTSNPKLGFTWRLNSDVAIRGSWGTSFRAPALTDVNPLVYSVKFFTPIPNFTGDSAIPGIPIPGGKLTNVAVIQGDQPDIKPERAHNWSAGLDLTPRWIDGLKVSTTYYHIRYSDEIFSPQVFPAAFTNPALYPVYRPFIHPVNNPANCTPGNPSTYDPALLPYVKAVGVYGSVSNQQLCQVQAWVDGRLTNIGSMTQSGADLSIAYDLATALGSWSFNVNAVRVLEERIQTIASLPSANMLGTIGNLVPWRGRGSLGWRRGPVSATVFVNYVGTYLNNQPIAGRSNETVPSWTTFDLTLGFDFGRLPNPGWLRDTGVSVSAQNLFARDPPIVLTAGGGQFDANNANVFGRIVQLNLMKKF